MGVKAREPMLLFHSAVTTSRGPRLHRPIWFLIVLLLLVAPVRVFAANPGDPDVPMNILPEPAAPGVVLLGTAPATVERPGSVADIAASITNAASSATAAASNFALQIAPYWWPHTPRHLLYKQYMSGRNIGDNFLQTLSLSVVTGSVAKAPGTALGFGARFSLWRGNVDTVFNGYAESIGKIVAADESLAVKSHALAESIRNQDTVLTHLQNFPPEAAKDTAAWQRQYRTRISIDNARADSIAAKDSLGHGRILARIKNIATSTPLQRFGWKLDVAGGSVLNFRSSVYDSLRFGKWGGWLTGGDEHRNWSLILTTRLLFGRMPADTTSLDFGARLTLPSIKVAVPSCEIIYRAYPTTIPSIAQRVRFDGLVDVPVGTNKAVSVTLGRDFGPWQKSKMILVLKLHMGFGTSRPL